jgi:hypothetical protein
MYRFAGANATPVASAGATGGGLVPQSDELDLGAEFNALWMTIVCIRTSNYRVTTGIPTNYGSPVFAEPNTGAQGVVMLTAFRYLAAQAETPGAWAYGVVAGGGDQHTAQTIAIKGA